VDSTYCNISYREIAAIIICDLEIRMICVYVVKNKNPHLKAKRHPQNLQRKSLEQSKYMIIIELVKKCKPITRYVLPYNLLILKSYETL